MRLLIALILNILLLPFVIISKIIGLFTNKKKKCFTYYVVKEFGMEKASIVFCNSIMEKFHDHRRKEEMLQFLREELDAAQHGREAALSLADELGFARSEYNGAMTEDAAFPIDGPDGPQDTLNTIINPYILDGYGSEGTKLKCMIVKKIYERYKICKNGYCRYSYNNESIDKIMEEDMLAASIITYVLQNRSKFKLNE